MHNFLGKEGGSHESQKALGTGRKTSDSERKRRLPGGSREGKGGLRG